MKRALVAALVVVAVAAGFFFGRRDDVRPVPPPSSAAVELVGATLLDGLGDYSFPVTTSNPEAQRWFNQGLMLAYGFNHDAAERSFMKATELDPGCAMCPDAGRGVARGGAAGGCGGCLPRGAEA